VWRAVAITLAGCGRLGFDAVAIGDAPPDAAPLDCTGAPARGLVATAQSGVAGIALDATTVYWANADDGTLQAQPRGETASTPIATGHSFPNGIAVEGGVVFWSDWGDATVWSTMDNTPISTTASFGRGIALDADALYCAIGGDATFGSSTQVLRIPRDGTASGVIATTPHAGGIARAGSLLYFSDAMLGTVSSIDLATGEVALLASSQDGPVAVTVDRGTVYWVNRALGATGQGTIVALVGGVPTPVVSGLSDPWYLAVDGCDLYWTNHSAGTVERAPARP
jgi:hypothetical protein